MNKLAELKPRLRLYGDTNKARGYMGAAMSLLHQTLAVAKLAGVPVYRLTNTLPDGTQIHAEVYGEQTAVSIITWEYQVQVAAPEDAPTEGECLLVTQLGAIHPWTGASVCSSFAIDTKTLNPFYYDWRYMDDAIKGEVPFVTLQNVAATDSELIGIPTGKAASFVPYPDMPDSNGNRFIEKITAPDLFTIDMQMERPTWRNEGNGLTDRPGDIAVYRWETLRVLLGADGKPSSMAFIAASTTTDNDREQGARWIDRVCKVRLTDMRVLEAKPITPMYVFRTSDEHRNHLLILSVEYTSDFLPTGGARLVLINTLSLEVSASAPTPVTVHPSIYPTAVALDDRGAYLISIPHDRDIWNPAIEQAECQYTSIAVDFGNGTFGQVQADISNSNAAYTVDTGSLYPEANEELSDVHEMNSLEIVSVDGNLYYTRSSNTQTQGQLNLTIRSQGYWNTAFEFGSLNRATGQLTRIGLFRCPDKKFTLNTGEYGKTHRMIKVPKSVIPRFNQMGEA